MSICSRNPNEAAYVGGKKHWTDVIKNSGSGVNLIWRQPEEDFNTNSTLVVMPGEEAVFIKGGIIEQTFDNGTYKLSTENYPFVSRLRNAFSGGISTFNCVVYFVNKTLSMQINWGTKAPMTVWDDMIAQSVKITAFGSYNVKITLPQIFLTKLIGNNIISFMPEELEDYFDSRFQEHIVSCIQQTLEDKATMIFRVISKLREFSEIIAPKIDSMLSDYGIGLENFSIININPEEEVRVAYNDLMRNTQWSIAEKQAEAIGDKARMEVLGDDWGRQQTANILGAIATNPSGGGAVAAGAGVGMGIAAGGMMGNMAQQFLTPLDQQRPNQPTPPPQPSGRFSQRPTASGTGTVTPDNTNADKSAETASDTKAVADDPVASLKQLKELLELGIIEQAEFDAKKAEIMSRM